MSSCDDIGGSNASVATSTTPMPSENIPLPEGWDMATDFDGKVYYIDHQNKKTTWIDPRDRWAKPEMHFDISYLNIYAVA